MIETPKTFDWVSAREKCNVREMFKRLVKVVTSDVKTAKENKILHNLKIDLICEREFSVVIPHDSGIGIIKGVLFVLEDSEIQVRVAEESRKLMFTARASLLDGGDCTFTIDEKKPYLYHPWQLSRLALEDLIFS